MRVMSESSPITPDDITPDDITPDDITPDDKDWTWVLERLCPECGFDAAALDVTATGDAVRANAASWAEALALPGVSERPAPTTWSALEYACHVRDVFDLFAVRLGLMLHDDDPLFANWDQDETAIAERYDDQDPAVVAGELLAASETVASAFDAVDGDQWARTGRRSDGASFTVDSFARYFLHDPVHHLWDIRKNRPRPVGRQAAESSLPTPSP